MAYSALPTWRKRALELVKDPFLLEKLVFYIEERKANGFAENTEKNFWRAVIIVSERSNKPLHELASIDLVKIFNSLLMDRKKNYGKVDELAKLLVQHKTLSTREVTTLLLRRDGKPINKVHAKFLMNLVAEKYPWAKLTKGSNIGWTQSKLEVLGTPVLELKDEDQRYARASIESYFSSIQHFLIWLNKGEMPESIKWFKKKRVRDSPVEDKDIWSEEEIMKAIDAEPSVRGKCIWSLLYESACRNSEFRNLKIGDISRRDQLYMITVDGKTGKRSIPIISSIPYLETLLQHHPNKNNSDAWLFFSDSTSSKPNTLLDLQDISRFLTKSAKRVSRKKIWPHLLRHSRLTFLASKLKESELRQFAGWAKDSDMPAVYVHLNAEDLKNSIMQVNGLIKEEETTSKLKPRQCIICSKQNPAKAKFCLQCGKALDIQTAIELQETKEKDDQLSKTMMEKMVTMQQTMEQMFEEIDQIRKQKMVTA